MNELVGALIEIYCGNVGAEYLHIENEQQKKWLKNKIEGNIILYVLFSQIWMQFKFDSIFVSIINSCKELILNLSQRNLWLYIRFISVSQYMFDDVFSIIAKFILISKLNFPPWILSSHHFPNFLNFFRMAYFLLLGEYGASGWSQGSKTEQIGQYKTLLRCDYTARFLNYKFRNAKVFGIEGCDSLLPG